MKKIFILSCIISTLPPLLAQQNCCFKPEATQAFAMLTADKQFVDTHANPEYFQLENPIGKDIRFETADGMKGRAYEIKSNVESNNYLLVFHEWWGLNDYMRKESEKYYQSLENVTVIAVDLYDGKLATERDSAAAYMSSVKKERAESIINGVLDYVGKDASIATVGWCFGGGWSMQASLLAGKQTKACIVYYGTPEEDANRLKSLNAPVLFIWPEQDQWINKDMISRFETNMKTAQKAYKIESYNADHAFANPSNPKFNKPFADDAFEKSTAFISLHLK